MLRLGRMRVMGMGRGRVRGRMVVKFAGLELGFRPIMALRLMVLSLGDPIKPSSSFSTDSFT